MTLLREASRTHFGPVKYDVISSGRPWWQVRYQGGKELAEWETPPQVITRAARPLARLWRTTRWEEVTKRGIIAMRLLCPNGMAAELECNNPEGRFIELKVGGRDIGFMPGGGMLSRAFASAHLIGCVEDDGQVQCWAFEKEPHPMALRPDTGRCGICGLDLQHCSGREVTATSHEVMVETVPDPAWPERVERTKRTRVDLHIPEGSTWVPLIGFRDNVYDMAYRGIGPLHLDVQGLAL